MSTPDAPADLSPQEALQRLRAHGPNQLDDAERRGLLSTLRHIGSEPMFMLMLAAAGIYLVLGDLGEGALLAFFALVTLGLVVFQERRSERALDALRTLSAPSVRVRRQGIEQRIASRDLVPGDVLLVSEGERVAADGRLLQATHLAVDESLLTGESVPVSKGVATTDNTVHAGTLVVAGHALVAPEEFPMALTVFLALGAWRLAKVKVLARRPAVIEALGATTLLCVDKTGTLTENRMRLRQLVGPEQALDLTEGARNSPPPLPESLATLLEHAVLASRRGSADPMDQALIHQGDATLASSARLHPDWTLLREHPVTPALLAMTQVWHTPSGARHVASKGAPEAIFGLCRLAPAEQARHLACVSALAARGLRVLAVAQAECPPTQPDDAPLTALPFRWLGLLAFEDPLREGVPASVALAHQAGIGVAMITGDHADTARAIAQQAGISVDGGVLTGQHLATMPAAELVQAVAKVRVFARVTPEQKLRLIQAFQARGEVVAMTGDGINDAPALKAAHIGIAMGVRGTDVAREAAGLVLLDENFSRIVGGVRMGRRIVDNLRHVMVYITAIHVPIAGLALLPMLLGLPPMLLPAHIVLTQLVIDPVCTLAFEGAPEHPALMQHPPRDPALGLMGALNAHAGLGWAGGCGSSPAQGHCGAWRLWPAPPCCWPCGGPARAPCFASACRHCGGWHGARPPCWAACGSVSMCRDRWRRRRQNGHLTGRALATDWPDTRYRFGANVREWAVLDKKKGLHFRASL
ncbi:HAD-IC family P-type ATPase [Aquabacterium lacunae]|nr:HAD-IC family P-type ATPase [Aquabacterium lacunae]